MAYIKPKGTVFQVDVGGILTAVAQVTEVTLGTIDPQVFESEPLSGGPGMVQTPTGFVTQEDTTGTIYYDPANASHHGLIAAASAPGSTTNLTDLDYSLDFTDTGGSSGTGVAAAIAFGPVNVTKDDGVTAGFTIKHNGILTLPTS